MNLVRNVLSSFIFYCGFVLRSASLHRAHLADNIAVYKPNVKRSRETSRPRRENNVKSDLEEIKSEGINWIKLHQNTNR
jgi:hypothetical protein